MISGPILCTLYDSEAIHCLLKKMCISVNSLVYRSLVSKLENVDPRKLKHEEKLAFWINLHNVLVMHVIIYYHHSTYLTIFLSPLLFLVANRVNPMNNGLFSGLFGARDSTK